MKKTFEITEESIEIEKSQIPEHLRERKDVGLLLVFLSGTKRERDLKRKKLIDFVINEI
mgnify:CR=1 FL=1